MECVCADRPAGSGREAGQLRLGRGRHIRGAFEASSVRPHSDVRSWRFLSFRDRRDCPLHRQRVPGMQTATHGHKARTNVNQISGLDNDIWIISKSNFCGSRQIFPVHPYSAKRRRSITTVNDNIIECRPVYGRQSYRSLRPWRVDGFVKRGASDPYYRDQCGNKREGSIVKWNKAASVLI